MLYIFLNCLRGFCSSDRWELRTVRTVLRAGSSWAAQLTVLGSCRYTLYKACYLASLYVRSHSLDFVHCIIYISLNSVPFILNTSRYVLYSNFCALKFLRPYFTKIHMFFTSGKDFGIKELHMFSNKAIFCFPWFNSSLCFWRKPHVVFPSHLITLVFVIPG